MSDESFSLKEMLMELMRETKSQSRDLASIQSEVKQINEHLERLNSKVATHEKRLNEHDGFIAKATGIVTLVATSITIGINKFL